MKIKEHKPKPKTMRWKLIVSERELDLIDTALNFARSNDGDLSDKQRQEMADLWGKI